MDLLFLICSLDKRISTNFKASKCSNLRVEKVEDYSILLQRSLSFYRKIDDGPFNPAKEKNECLKSWAFFKKLKAHSLGLTDKRSISLPYKDESASIIDSAKD